MTVTGFSIHLKSELGRQPRVAQRLPLKKCTFPSCTLSRFLLNTKGAAPASLGRSGGKKRGEEKITFKKYIMNVLARYVSVESSLVQSLKGCS